jgi:hypothetical protein
MLSDRERRELAAIEEDLTAGDRRFAETFSTAPSAGRRRRWPVRTLLGFGVFLLVVGILTDAEEIVLQGLACLGGGLGWAHWRAAHPLAGNGPGGSGPLPGARPDGLPPGGFQSA